MARQLIMGGAVGYGVEELHILLRSAALNVPDADLLLFTDRATPEFQQQLARIHPRVRLAPAADARWRADLWRSPKRRRKLTRLSPARSRRRAFWLRTPWPGRGLAAFHATVAKHFWAWDAFRKGLIGDARHILFIDTRDLLFQADPFVDASVPPGGLLLSAEPRTITTESHLYRLIRRIHSPRSADLMLNLPVLCAGAILGEREAIGLYLRAMTREFTRHATDFFGRFVDQPVHCKILHADRVVPFRAISEGQSWISNLLFLKGEAFRIDESGLRTLDGDLVRIVHRYDRFPRIVEWAQRRFGPAGGPSPGAPFDRPLPFPKGFANTGGCGSWLPGSPGVAAPERATLVGESSGAPRDNP